MLTKPKKKVPNGKVPVKFVIFGDGAWVLFWMRRFACSAGALGLPGNDGVLGKMCGGHEYFWGSLLLGCMDLLQLSSFDEQRNV